jgi:hypothetical protein
MAISSSSKAVSDGLGQTERKDAWWVEPLLTGGGLALFGVYATWAALQGAHFLAGPYHSPFYSPLIMWAGMPTWLSPAFLILPFPLLFRATCYYYRKAYYRAYFMEPPACAVGEPFPHRNYTGETKFPFILQNLHRYFLYFAIIFIFILAWDAAWAFNFEGRFGIGLGTLVMVSNVILLALYTFSCHSWRHLIGGNLNCFSCDKNTKLRHGAWKRVSVINENHMRWAWLSLFSVGFTDLYIRLLSMGVITDWRIL